MWPRKRSLTHHAARSPFNGGFTLIELLVVIVIIALGSSLAVAWLGPTAPADRLAASARELAAEFELAADVATARQRVIGWQPVAQGYRFVTWHPSRGWQPWDATNSLAPGRWSHSVQLTRQPPSDDTTAPWLVWLPDGEVVGARLQMESEGERLTLEIDALGARGVEVLP